MHADGSYLATRTHCCACPSRKLPTRFCDPQSPHLPSFSLFLRHHHFRFRRDQDWHHENPQNEVRIFDLFFNWLYTQTLWDESADECEWPTMENLLKLWVFADMARISRLMSQCLDTLKSISDTLGEVFVGIAWVWKKSTMGSPIRRFLIDRIVWELSAEDLTNELNM